MLNISIAKQSNAPIQQGEENRSLLEATNQSLQRTKGVQARNSQSGIRRCTVPEYHYYSSASRPFGHTHPLTINRLLKCKSQRTCRCITRAPSRIYGLNYPRLCGEAGISWWCHTCLPPSLKRKEQETQITETRRNKPIMDRLRQLDAARTTLQRVGMRRCPTGERWRTRTKPGSFLRSYCQEVDPSMPFSGKSSILVPEWCRMHRFVFPLYFEKKAGMNNNTWFH